MRPPSLTRCPPDVPDVSDVSDSERLLFGGELAYDVGWERHEGAWLKLGLWTMAKELPRMVAMGMRLAHLAAELGRSSWTGCLYSSMTT